MKTLWLRLSKSWFSRSVFTEILNVVGKKESRDMKLIGHQTLQMTILVRKKKKEAKPSKRPPRTFLTKIELFWYQRTKFTSHFRLVLKWHYEGRIGLVQDVLRTSESKWRLLSDKTDCGTLRADRSWGAIPWNEFSRSGLDVGKGSFESRSLFYGRTVSATPCIVYPMKRLEPDLGTEMFAMVWLYFFQTQPSWNRRDTRRS